MSDMLQTEHDGPLVRRFAVDEYHRMAEAGVFAADERLELVDGRIVTMAPIGPRHASRTRAIAELFRSRFGERAVVLHQDPVTLDASTEPQPDIAVVTAPAERYERAHPTTADVLLLVEISDTSLAVDRGPKLRTYARTGVPEYWIVNLADDVVEVFCEPAADEYRSQRMLRRGDRIAPRSFPHDRFATDDLLPRHENEPPSR